MNPENPFSEPNLIKPGERIEHGLWRSEFFDIYKDRIVVGASTEILKEEVLKKETSQPVMGPFLRNKEKAIAPLREKISALRILLQFLKRLDPSIDAHKLVKPELAHTNNVTVIDEDYLSKKTQYESERGDKLLIPQTDGLVTNLKNIPLIISGGDCPPVIIFDPVKNAMGLYHSSRQSTWLGISENVINLMKKQYQSNPSNLKVIIGPAVSQANYPVSEKEYDQFAAKFSQEELAEIFDHIGEQYFMDIARAITIILGQRLGLDEKNIFVSQFCTSRDKIFPSARRDKELSDRFLVAAMLK